jgi:hypothetical protein
LAGEGLVGRQTAPGVDLPEGWERARRSRRRRRRRRRDVVRLRSVGVDQAARAASAVVYPAGRLVLVLLDALLVPGRRVARRRRRQNRRGPAVVADRERGRPRARVGRPRTGVARPGGHGVVRRSEMKEEEEEEEEAQRRLAAGMGQPACASLSLRTRLVCISIIRTRALTGARPRQ